MDFCSLTYEQVMEIGEKAWHPNTGPGFHTHRDGHGNVFDFHQELVYESGRVLLMREDKGGRQHPVRSLDQHEIPQEDWNHHVSCQCRYCATFNEAHPDREL